MSGWRGYNKQVSPEDNWLLLQYDEVKKAVDSGDAGMKTKLAWLMLSGLGGAEKDVFGAVALLEERVKENDSDALWMLGVCCDCGIGIEQNFQRAVALYKQSGAEGNSIGSFFEGLERGGKWSGLMRNGCL